MNYLIATIKRELQQMFARPLYMFSSVVVMIISCIFYLTLMHTGTPEKMPIVIVDHDCSSISRRIIHELNSTPAVDIVAVLPTYGEARDRMQRGEIYGFLEIPENFYADLASQRQPTIAFYVNYAYTMGGMTAYKQMLTLSNQINGAFLMQVLKLKGMSEFHIMDIVQPIAIDPHFLFNPYSNYPIYLCSILLPGTLGVVILMLTIFSIGFELKESTTHEWLRTAGNSYLRAMVGKMLPYTVLFAILGWGILLIMYVYLQFPINGNVFGVGMNLLGFIIAMQCFGVLLIGLLPVLRDALSAGALLGMMSFTMSGFTFPSMGMLGMVQAVSYLFPLRHYYLACMNETLIGGPWQRSLTTYLAYLVFILLAMSVGPRLHKAMVYLNYPKK